MGARLGQANICGGQREKKSMSMPVMKAIILWEGILRGARLLESEAQSAAVGSQ